MSLVSVKNVQSYDDELMYEAVKFHFDTFNIKDELKPEMRVVIKPNLLAARKPELCVTTHHSLLYAVIRCLKELGVKNITVAESSGGPYVMEHMRSVYSAAGYKRPEIAPYLNYDFSYKEVKTPDGFTVKSFNIITPVTEADYIINLPKLKTHSMTTVSAGVKNLFGTIPGLQKPDMHCRYPELSDFTNMLCELAMTVKPNFTILDAVDSMEGNGPNGGTVKHTGLTLAAKDVFSLDVAAVRFMGLDPEATPHLISAKAHGFYPEDVVLTGDELITCSVPFKMPDSVMRPSFLDSFPSFLQKPASAIMNAFLRSYPVVDKTKCVGCGKCAESCPQHIITVTNHKASMPKKGCISCFCCQEMCPVHAIDSKRRINL